jgi:hypothetical protein
VSSITADLLTGDLYKDARRALIDAAARLVGLSPLARTAPKALVVF